jgi:hypothetical protein
MRKDCDQVAVWAGHFVLYAPPPYPPSACAPSNDFLYLCDEHRHETKVEDVLTDEGWKQIAAGFVRAGLVEPCRERTELVFAPLQ